MGARDDRNPLHIPTSGVIDSGDLRGVYLPAAGTASALISAYKGKSGSRDAETGVTWSRGMPYICFSSDRGPDIISVLRRIGDDGIYGFLPPRDAGDTLFMYVKSSCSRRAWAVVRAIKGDDDQEEDDQSPDACDDAADAEGTDDDDA